LFSVVFTPSNPATATTAVFGPCLSSSTVLIKGQCHEIFCFWFFSNLPYRWQIFPPLLLTPVANLPRCQRYRRKIRHRCQRRRWQIMATISGCRHLKVNLKANMYIYVNPSTHRCPNKIIKIFLLEGFSICHRCQRHRWQTLSCAYLPCEFSKKFDTALLV
jgi:hypothetical protein